MGNPREAEGLSAPVRSIMAECTITIGPASAMRTVADLIAENDVGAIPVLRDNALVGVVGERDVARALADDGDVEEERVGDWMAADVSAIDGDVTIERAAHTMLEGGVRHLPVVDGDKVVGMVSMRDLLACYVSLTE